MQRKFCLFVKLIISVIVYFPLKISVVKKKVWPGKKNALDFRVRIVDFKTLRFAVCHIKVTTQTETEHLHYNIHEIIKALLILI